MIGYLFVAPWIILSLVFLVYPLLLAFKMSFMQANLLQPQATQFVGFGNWIRAALDPLFWESLFNVIYNQVIFIALSFVMALVSALLLKQAPRAGSVFRTIYFLPVITSVTASMIIFSFFVSPTGVVQTLLIHAHILKQPIYWTFTKWLPMPVIALFSSWKWFGIQTIILLGGLYAINHELYEAAEVDGAGPVTKLFRITIPQLNRQIVFIMTMNVINGLQMFTEAYMNFGIDGGPFHAGLTPVLYLYGVGFQQMNMGYAAALGLLLALVIYVLTMAQMKLLERED